MSSCSASGKAASSYRKGLCPRSDSLHLIFSSSKVENLFQNLLIFLHQAGLLLAYRPMISALQCPVAMSGYRVSLPCFLLPPTPPPMGRPMDPCGQNRTLLLFFTPNIHTVSLPPFPVSCQLCWFYLSSKALVIFNFFLEPMITSLGVRSPKF